MYISIKDTYKAMILFLEHFYFKNNSDDIGGLLGDLSLLSDGTSADPAALYEWYEVIKTKNKQISEFPEDSHLSSDEAYDSMCEFLQRYVNRTSSPDIEDLIINMKLAKDTPQDKTGTVNLWNTIVDFVKNNPQKTQEKTKFRLH